MEEVRPLRILPLLILLSVGLLDSSLASECECGAGWRGADVSQGKLCLKFFARNKQKRKAEDARAQCASLGGTLLAHPFIDAARTVAEEHGVDVRGKDFYIDGKAEPDWRDSDGERIEARNLPDVKYLSVEYKHNGGRRRLNWFYGTAKKNFICQRSLFDKILLVGGLHIIPDTGRIVTENTLDVLDYYNDFGLCDAGMHAVEANLTVFKETPLGNLTHLGTFQTMLDGKIVVCGTFDEFFGKCYEWDVVANTWNLHSTMNKPRARAIGASAMIGGNWWIFGGDTSMLTSPSTEFYADGAWHEGPVIPLAVVRSVSAVAISDSKAFITATSVQGDPSVNTWTFDGTSFQARALNPTPRSFSSCGTFTSSGGHQMIFETGANPEDLNDTEYTRNIGYFNLTSNSWTLAERAVPFVLGHCQPMLFGGKHVMYCGIDDLRLGQLDGNGVSRNIDLSLGAAMTTGDTSQIRIRPIEFDGTRWAVPETDFVLSYFPTGTIKVPACSLPAHTTCN